MSAMPNYTVVIGVDKATLPYLLTNLPTWRLLRQNLWERPWLVFFDPSESKGIQDVDVVLDALGASDATLIEWNGNHAGYPTQREKMLSGHVYVSRHVRTDWFVKIDCDAIAHHPAEWPKAEWFADDADGREPVLVGPKYGYTRAKSGGGTLWDWCERMEQFGDRYFRTPRAGWESLIGDLDHRRGPKMKKRRWVSWLGWQRADWVREMADLFERECGPGRLPLPSHDSCLWMAADRAGELVRVGSDMKAGWANRLQVSSCRKLVAEVMEQYG